MDRVNVNVMQWTTNIDDLNSVGTHYSLFILRTLIFVAGLAVFRVKNTVIIIRFTIISLGRDMSHNRVAVDMDIYG